MDALQNAVLWEELRHRIQPPSSKCVRAHLNCCYDPGLTREQTDYEFDEIDEGNVFE